VDFTISIDGETLTRARALAEKRGLSLQQLLLETLHSLAGKPIVDATSELMTLLRDQPGNSGGRPWSREDVYRGRI
jgi:hypothetical protein